MAKPNSGAELVKQPLLINRSDVPAVYGFSERQVRRLCEKGLLSRVHIHGPTGPVMLYTAEIEQLIRAKTTPPGKKAGRKPPAKKKKAD